MNRSKYRELFRLRAEGKLPPMECTKSCLEHLNSFLMPDSVFSIYKSYDGFHFLDVPCGAGHYFTMLQSLGDIVYHGVDVDSGMIKNAKEVWGKTMNATFTVGDVCRLPFPDDSFNVVLCYNLLLHLPQGYKKALQELCRVVKPDGRLLIRSLFDDHESILSIDNDFYNTYSRDDVRKFLLTLPDKYSCWFYPDSVVVDQKDIEMQSKTLNVDESEFTVDSLFKGYNMNYETVIIEKWRME